MSSKHAVSEGRCHSPDLHVPTFQELKQDYIYLRSIRALIERTEYVSWIPRDILNQLEYVFTEKGFASILDVQKIIHSLTKIGLGPEKTLREKKELLKITKSEDSMLDEKLEKRLTDYLTNGARQSKAVEWKWRLQNAIHEAVVNKKWFPLFGTYTVDPKQLEEVGCLTRDELWKNTPAWDKFVKRFKADVAESLGYGRKPSKWPKTHKFFQYFAIIEHGKSGDHPHIHVIWLCKNIPQAWKEDPNDTCPNNIHFDIPAASTLWPHGIQRVTSGIFITDSWFEQNWKTPRKYNKETGLLTDIKIGDAGAIAGYISKYMSKGQTKKWNHRVKATKSLGMKKIKQLLGSMKCVPILEALATRPNTYLKSFQMQQSTSCPLSLLKRISKMELEKQYHISVSALGERSLWKIWTKAPSGFYTQLMNSVANGLKPWKMMPEQRYKLYTRILGEVDSTAHCKKILDNTIKWLDMVLEPMISCKPYIKLKVKRA